MVNKFCGVEQDPRTVNSRSFLRNLLCRLRTCCVQTWRTRENIHLKKRWFTSNFYVISVLRFIRIYVPTEKDTPKESQLKSCTQTHLKPHAFPPFHRTLVKGCRWLPTDVLLITVVLKISSRYPVAKWGSYIRHDTLRTSPSLTVQLINSEVTTYLTR